MKIESARSIVGLFYVSLKKCSSFNHNNIYFQEQYKTIFLVLHEMCKAQVNPKIPTDFLKCLETGAQYKPVNSSALRKEFQVRFVFKVFSIWYILKYFSLLIISLYWNRLVIGTLGTCKKNVHLFIWSFCCSVQCITTSA